MYDYDPPTPKDPVWVRVLRPPWNLIRTVLGIERLPTYGSSGGLPIGDDPLFRERAAEQTRTGLQKFRARLDQRPIR